MNRVILSLKLQRDFLQALRRAPNGTATIDGATPAGERAQSYPHGGKWPGIALRGLAEKNLIDPVRDSSGRRVAIMSRRPSRLSENVGLWRLRDAVAADRFIRQLNRRLKNIPTQPLQGNLFVPES